jgi:hypothetical protein
MGRLAILVAVVLMSAHPSGATNPVSLGYSEETTIVGPGTDACAGGVLVYSHDGSFESAYAWHYGGVVPPYYGALGEAYAYARATGIPDARAGLFADHGGSLSPLHPGSTPRVRS